MLVQTINEKLCLQFTIGTQVKSEKALDTEKLTDNQLSHKIAYEDYKNVNCLLTA